MNFPHQFGNKFPPIPPPFMPWNINPFNSFPFAPPLPNPSFFGPSSTQNPIYIQQQNNYFGSQRNTFPVNEYTNPYFEKLINQSDKFSKNKQTFPFINNNTPLQIIEISDDEAPRKVKGNKKREVSKQKRIRFELKRLNNKKYTKALKKNEQYMQKQMKEFMQKVETQTKRITRVSGRIPKDIRDDNDQIIQREKQMIFGSEQQQERQQSQMEQKVKQESHFDGIEFGTKFPHLINNTQQIQIWKKSIKEQILLRKMNNQNNH